MSLASSTRTLGIFVELGARRYPLVVFQAASMLIHRDISNFSWATLIAAWWSSRFYHHMLVADIDRDMSFKLVRFLERFSQCEFTPIPLETAVDSRTATLLVERSITMKPERRVWEDRLRSLVRQPNLETFVKQNVRVFQVSRGRSISKPCPIAFTMRTGGYVFLTEKPPHLGAVQRFFLLHELGHLSMLSKYTWLRAKFGCAPFFPIVLWSFPQLAPGWLAAISFVVYWSVLVVLRDFVWPLVRGVGRVLDEMSSDRFALTHLEPAERKKVAEFFQTYPVADDEMLPPEGNVRRRRQLAENLDLILKNRGEPEALIGYKQSGKTEWPVLISFAALFALAACTKPVSFESVWGLAFVAVTMTFPLTYCVSNNRALCKLLSQALPMRASIPADRISRWPREPRWVVKLRGWLGLAPVLPKDMPPWMR